MSRFGERFRRFLRAIRPRYGSAMVAIIGMGTAIGYATSEEAPTGGVRGQIHISDSYSGAGQARVVFTPVESTTDEGDDGGPTTRRFTTRPDGRFAVSNIRTGLYRVSAYADAHQDEGTLLQIDEGDTADLELELKRTQPALSLAQHEWTFSTAERAGISVQGYVDATKPKGQDSVDVSVYKSRLSSLLSDATTAEALEKVGRSYDSPPELPKELLHPAHADAPRSFDRRSVPISNADREGFYYQRIDFGKLTAGLYLVEMGHREKVLPANSADTTRVCAWVLVTDTALVVKRAQGRALAFAVDMQTGTPLHGAKVRVLRKGSLVTEATTDSQGLASLTYRTPASTSHRTAASESVDEEGPARNREDARYTFVALRGEDEAVVGENGYSYEERGAFAVHAYTDRPIYRPGQLIYYKGIVRRKMDGPTRFTVPSGEPVSVEIRDPSGEPVLKEKRSSNPFGSFFGQVQLSPEAPTGRYTIITTVRGEKHTQDIDIASYRKPEFKVTVEPKEKHYVRGDQVEVTINGQFYFGAPLAGAKVHYRVHRSPDWSASYERDPSEGSDDAEESGDSVYYRGHREESYYGESVTEGDVVLDDNGKAIVRFKADMPDEPEAPQEQVFTVSVDVTDESERQVNESGEVHVSAGDFNLTVSPEGYVAQPGKPASVRISAKDHDGKPVPGVRVDVRPEFQKWFHGEYQKEPLPGQTAVTGPDGNAMVNVVPPRSGEIKLAAAAIDQHGHKIHGRAYIWVADDRGGDLETEYADLSVLTDKRRYGPGDTARVLINSARKGQTVLLTVEGHKVYSSQLVPMNSKSSVVRVPILEEYGPNVYLNACYVRSKKFAHSEATLRVNLPRRKVTVSIRALPARVNEGRRARGEDSAAGLPRYHPGDPISYQIETRDSQGRPVQAEFSFGVVDEAIYALREDNPKAIRDSFYPHRYNEVETSHSFAVQYLGDADKAEPKIVARKRFPDTAYWKPDLRTGSDGKATISFQLPDNLTTWRATAVAQTMDTAVGFETNKVIVSKDFFVRVETPRFLTQHDTSRIQAIIHNESEVKQTALVRLRAENLNISNEAQQTMTIEAGKTGQAFWNVSAESYGAAKITVTAWTPRIAGRTQYTDGYETALPIRPHGREQFTTVAGEITSAKPEAEVIRLDPNAVPGASRLTIRITPSVASAMVGALDYVIGYPYGCTEQTMSRFLPDLLVQRLLRKRPGLVKSRYAAELPEMVRNGLSRLYRFQHESGAWGWWEHDADDPWMTAYVLYGLGTAKSEGYSVSPSVVTKATQAALKMLPSTPADERAFLLYAVALAGDKKGASTNRGAIDLRPESPETVAYTILLNKVLGDPGVPPGMSTPVLMGLLGKHAASTGLALHWSQEKSELWYDHWNDRLATSIALRAILANNPADGRIPSILRWLMTQRTDSYWHSTRDTSAVLAALTDYLETQAAGTEGGEVKIAVNGQEVKSIALTSEVLLEPDIVVKIPAPSLKTGKNEVTLTRSGGSETVFYAMQLRQTVASEDMGSAGPAGYRIKREYLRLDSTRAGDSWRLDPREVHNSFRVGDRVRVKLTITAPRDMSYVLIEDPFPSGCEVTERGTAEEEMRGDHWGYWYSNVDVRDDRIAYFARTLTKGTHILEYNLRAQTPGSCHVLPTAMESMYAPELHAESAETRIEVR